MMEAQKNRQLKNKIHIQPKKKVKFSYINQNFPNSEKKFFKYFSKIILLKEKNYI